MEEDFVVTRTVVTRIAAVAAATTLAAACGGSDSTGPSDVACHDFLAQFSQATGDTVNGSQGLKYIEVVIGSGAEAALTNTVDVNYSGYLASNNNRFDTSCQEGTPVLRVTLGASQVIVKPASNAQLENLFDGVRSAKPRKRPAAAKKRPAKSGGEAELAGRRVLIIDDDIRNIYSLTSVLEAQGAEVLHAERGAEGIAILEANPAVDVALVDIMMPEMDGYETMRRIRANPEIADTPLVAVTAKAMKGDRQKCLDAGASDYLAKPVDIDMLLALMRVQIERTQGGRIAAETAAA